MIIVDANLLIYAVNSRSPHHVRARAWLEQTLSGTAPVGLPWIVLLAFVRVTTRPGVMARPLPLTDAMAYVDSWLQQPCVEIVARGEHHWQIFKGLLEGTGAAGNLTSDAHIAALALERGARVCSADHDFARFPGIKHINPFTISD